MPPLPAARPVPAVRDPADRGVTTIADRVVEKIAAAAAAEVPHVVGLRRRLVGRDFGTAAVRAGAQLDGSVGVLTLDLGVEYPAPVRATTRQVRAHVLERVESLCAVRLDHVDITVAMLRRPEASTKRRVQ